MNHAGRFQKQLAHAVVSIGLFIIIWFQYPKFSMSKFVTVDVIGKKRDKKELTTDEIKFVVDGFTSGAIADYQMSALLMAIVVLFLCEVFAFCYFVSRFVNIAAQWNE